jgi:hypothetical protein
VRESGVLKATLADTDPPALAVHKPVSLTAKGRDTLAAIDLRVTKLSR